jgi:glycosyltransferase involved in cell wall biosynthesis
VDVAPDVLRLFELAPLYDGFRATQRRADAVRALDEVRAGIVNHHNTVTLCQVLAEDLPDVVYLWNLGGIGGLGLVAAIEHVGLPWVWHLMDTVPLDLCCLQGKASQLLIEFLLEHASGWYVACSSHLVDELAAGGFPLQKERTTIVPNWVSTITAPHRNWWHGGELRMIAAGQIGTHKGTDVAIAAVDRLRDMGYANIRLDIYGAPRDHSLLGTINRLDLRDLVRILPSVTQDELRERLLEYDIFVFPTWSREPFGFAALEAAAQGCVPVVSADCGFAEWFVDGVHCIKIDRDRDSLALAVGQILSGQVDLETVGKRARSVVQSDFTLVGARMQVEQSLETAIRASRAARLSPALRRRRLEQALDIGALAEYLAEAILSQSTRTRAQASHVGNAGGNA